MRMTFHDVDGVPTRCIVAGDERAPPLLLVHGVSLTADIWLRNVDELGRDFFVVAVDMLGHGFTRPPGGRGVSIPEKVAHLLRLADTLGFDRFALGGSSYGALVSANLYLSARDRISKLIINGSGSCFNTQEQLAGFVSRIGETYRPNLTTSSPAMWRERLEGTFHDPGSIPGELGVILSLCYAQPWAAACWEETIRVLGTPDELRPFRILDRLEEIAVETLVVWGREDRGGILESAVQAVGRMPSARLVTFERCGHLPMTEHPALYNDTIRTFLQS